MTVHVNAADGRDSDLPPLQTSEQMIRPDGTRTRPDAGRPRSSPACC